MTTTIDSTLSFDDLSPNLSFKVGLDTGSFVENFTQPIFGEIEKIISPLKPIEDVLRTNLPGLDQIGININLLGIATTFAPNEAPALVTFFDTLNQVSSLVNAADSLTTNGSIINLGEFTLSKDGISNSLPQTNILDKFDPNITSFLNKAKSIPGGGLTFPLLETPSTAFDLLLGNNINLLNFTIPSVNAFKAEYSAPPIVIPIPPIPIPLVGELSGGVTLGTSGLKFGFDTYGLKQNNPLQGLFIDSSQPIFQVSPELSASLRAEAYIAAGGARISVKGDVSFYLPQSPDNKFRIADFSNFSNFDIKGGNVDLIGSIFGRIGPPISFLSKEFSADLFRISLFDFGGNSNNLGEKFKPNLATYDSATQNLRLNMGAEVDRNKRKIKPEEINERFKVTGDSNNLTVAAFGQQEDFSNVTKIIALADTGDDTVIVDANITSELYGGSGKDVLRGGSNTDILHGEEDDDTLNGNAGDDFLFGDQGNDALFSGIGIDRLWGEDGEDTLNGGSQGDFLYGGDDNDVLVGGNTFTDSQGNTFTDGDDLLDGGSGEDLLFGEAGSDTLYGNDGNDFLEGGDGNDLIDGGNDFDTVSYESTSAAPELPHDGVGVNIDETKNYQAPGGYIYSDSSSNTVIGFDSTLGDVIEKGTATDGLGNTDTLKNLEGINGSNLDDILIGNSVFNTVQGLAGNDILIGNASDDRLDGGDGIDTVSYRYDPNPEGIFVNLDENTATDGFDTTDELYNIENVQGSNSADNIIGNNQDNWLLGDGGDDTLTGGAGADTLVGEDGIDTASYTDSNAGVSVDLTTGKATGGDAEGDTLQTIENLEGSQGADTLTGDAADNKLLGQDGRDVLSGQAGQDSLYGGDGNDTLDGGTGNDSMFGGIGNDVYVIENPADTITEEINQGRDTVKSSITYTLGANLENLILTGKESINGMGNNLENIMLGNDAGNFLFGDAGKDILSGGNGDDILDGGVKNDIMAGGLGNDTYIVDSSADQIFENENEGIDTVNASASYALSSNLENLNLTGTNAINGTGNNLNNTINGNSAVNYIYAGEGADLVNGAAGDDYIYGEAGDDSISGSEGNDNLNGGLGDDTVFGNKGQDWLVGDLGNDQLLGGAEEDHIVGGTGDDVMIGGADKDWLTGGAGADQFVLQLRKDKADIITDFRLLDGDLIAISTKRLGKKLKIGKLSAAQFTLGSAATNASDRFIYDSSTGKFFFDADGNGEIGQIQLATLSKGLSLTNRNIVVAG